MQERSGHDWRVTLGLGAMVAGGVLLVGAFPGYAGATGAQTDRDDLDQPGRGNPTCGELAPDGTIWTEFKVEPVRNGTFSDDTLTVTIDVTETDDGPVFDWTSNIGIDAVFVKGGPGGLLYVYDPPAESTGDTGLHAPVNPNNDKFFGLSHLSFCYDVDQATTTTTERDTTTTTTERDTTTTTEQGTTTTAQQGGTSTTALGGGGTTPTTQPAGGLPQTGNNSVPLLALGGALLCGGTASGRRHPSVPSQLKSGGDSHAARWGRPGPFGPGLAVSSQIEGHITGAGPGMTLFKMNDPGRLHTVRDRAAEGMGFGRCPGYGPRWENVGSNRRKKVDNGVGLAGRGPDDDAALGFDVDAVRAEVCRHLEPLAVAVCLAELAARSSREFVGVVQVEPHELAADSTRALGRRPHPGKCLRDRGVVGHRLIIRDHPVDVDGPWTPALPAIIDGGVRSASETSVVGHADGMPASGVSSVSASNGRSVANTVAASSAERSVRKPTRSCPLPPARRHERAAVGGHERGSFAARPHAARWTIGGLRFVGPGADQAPSVL